MLQGTDVTDMTGALLMKLEDLTHKREAGMHPNWKVNYSTWVPGFSPGRFFSILSFYANMQPHGMPKSGDSPTKDRIQRAFSECFARSDPRMPAFCAIHPARST